MRLLVVAVVRGALEECFSPIAESFLECFGQCPVVAEIEGGRTRGSLQIEIKEEERSDFLGRFLRLGKRIQERAPDTRPETNWIDLDEAPDDVIVTRTLV